MPAKRQSIPVPLFSAYEISLAQECALELWRGFDFESDDEKEMSDEELLHSFSSSFHAVLSNPNTPHSITEYEVRRLARVAKIKAFYRSAIPTDFPAGIQSLETNVTKNYRQWRSRSAGSSRKSLVLDSVIQVSSDFVTNPGHSPNGNYRVPLASRLLFYAVPEMPIFAYSNALAQKLQFQSRPQAAYAYFFDAMFKGVWLNRRRLEMLVMPVSSLLSASQLTALNLSRWWIRRVLDLALMNNLNLSQPKTALIQSARTNANRYQ